MIPCWRAMRRPAAMILILLALTLLNHVAASRASDSAVALAVRSNETFSEEGELAGGEDEPKFVVGQKVEYFSQASKSYLAAVVDSPHPTCVNQYRITIPKRASKQKKTRRINCVHADRLRLCEAENCGLDLFAVGRQVRYYLEKHKVWFPAVIDKAWEFEPDRSCAGGEYAIMAPANTKRKGLKRLACVEARLISADSLEQRDPRIAEASFKTMKEELESYQKNVQPHIIMRDIEELLQKVDNQRLTWQLASLEENLLLRMKVAQLERLNRDPQGADAGPAKGPRVSGKPPPPPPPPPPPSWVGSATRPAAGPPRVSGLAGALQNAAASLKQATPIKKSSSAPPRLGGLSDIGAAELLSRKGTLKKVEKSEKKEKKIYDDPFMAQLHKRLAVMRRATGSDDEDDLKEVQDDEWDDDDDDDY
eukprot:gnl/TRDRNA2_/TRDRNA2_155035_c0_seq3.p1 gnl/TRDRNA2_/TRDRNA2_155035_c0~~gnl/TRDRNA2_/TRDRNA2_155035_c0_seq3.p1  ORF type:complete len:422 (-),score=84.64 gnl/TRDRNA2_/TRDRNA2_155035_c0_seq3:45-1310(-)